MTDLGKVLILGSSGQLGIELRRFFDDCPGVEACGRDKVDFTNERSLRQIIRQVRPNIIINAAAYTAVDRAESEPELAMAINGVAPRILAEEATKLDALLVHYSTDYVFDGSKVEPWVETDEPAPLNVYGYTKLAGELAVIDHGNKYLIFRTSWVFSPHGHNFMLTIRRLAKERESLTIVNDQYGAPSSADVLAKATRLAVNKAISGHLGSTKNWSGIYHMSCAGSTTWYGFAQAIIEKFRKYPSCGDPELVGISTEQYITAARRPKNSILNNNKLNTIFGVVLPEWKNALAKIELTAD
jgi:dTDP-4-dehydrorhamnose reductase